MARKQSFDHDLSSEGQRVLARYVDQGWFDATAEHDSSSSQACLRPGYLVISTGMGASGMLIAPLSEVQITSRRCTRAFRGRQLIVASEATRRFDLLDLKVRYRSQFHRAEPLSLRTCIDETEPDLIQWPMEVCRAGDDFNITAIISEREAGEAGDLGAAFELILLGDVAG